MLQSLFECNMPFTSVLCGSMTPIGVAPPLITTDVPPRGEEVAIVSLFIGVKKKKVG